MKNRKHWKQIQAVVLSMAMCFSMGGVPLAGAEPAEAEATEENADTETTSELIEIHIASLEDLEELAENCRLDRWSQDKAVYLDADIMLDGTFRMIPSFGGRFYGQGHTIGGLSLNQTGSYTGLFRYVQESGSIIDLKVNGQVQPEGSQNGVGGIVGSNAGRIEKCSFQGSVHGKSYIGGIAGRNQATGQIINCTTTGVVYGNHGVGGIAGENRGVISRCRNESYINAVITEESVDLSSLTIEDITSNESATDITDAGGIAGISSGVIQNCTNQGLIGYQHTGYNIGGIVGRQSGYINECVNEGVVYGRKEVGGIVGQMEPNMVLEYTQTTLQMIQPQLQALRGSVDKALSDLNGTTTTIGKELEALSPYVTSASEAAETMLNAYKDEKAPLLSDEEETTEETTETGTGETTEGTTEAGAGETTEEPGNVLDHISDAISGREESTETGNILDHIGDVVSGEEESTETGSVLDHISDTISDTDKEQIRNDLDEWKVSEDNAQFQAAKTDFSNSMKHIADSLARIGKLMAEDGTTINQDIQTISDQIFGILDTRTYGTTQEESGDVIEDVSDEDSQDSIEGKVAGSRNQGVIAGDLNVGGIAGAMAIEHDLDPEDDIQIEGEASINVQYRTRVVIRDCENAGEIQGKKDCTGGIVGNMAMGSVMECRNTGRTISDGGDYVGGIAGLAEGIIRDCSVKCWLSGRNYIGGIAGQGREIYTSNALIRLEDGVECLGAVAGKLADNGTAEGNQFIDTGLAGIDDISYSGIAEPITQAELVAQENIPNLFRSCTVQFLADDELVDSITVDYGKGIRADAMPEVPEKEGCYGVWEEWDNSKVCFDERIQAVYTSYVAALESEETRNDHMALLLVDGAFTEEDVLLLHTWQGDADVAAGAKKQLEAWELTIPEDGADTHTIRYLPPENEKGITIYVSEGTEWKQADAEEDGKYLTFEASGENVTFLVLAKKKPFWYSWFHSGES